MAVHYYEKAYSATAEWYTFYMKRLQPLIFFISPIALAAIAVLSYEELAFYLKDGLMLVFLSAGTVLFLYLIPLIISISLLFWWTKIVLQKRLFVSLSQIPTNPQTTQTSFIKKIYVSYRKKPADTSNLLAGLVQ